jgi:hypothetical protein
MKVSPHPNLKSFKDHPDVHMHGAEHDTSKVTHSDQNEAEFHKHMAAAKEIHDTHGHAMYNAVHPKHSGDGGHLATYINKTVRHDEVPNVKGFQQHVADHHAKQAEKVKTEKSKSEKQAEGASQVAHIEKNKNHYSNLLAQHHHLAQAKNALVRSLETHEGGYDHHIAGKKSKPEGFVVNHDHNGKTEPSKLVNRAEFAKSNLLKVRKCAISCKVVTKKLNGFKSPLTVIIGISPWELARKSPNFDFRPGTILNKTLLERIVSTK